MLLNYKKKLVTADSLDIAVSMGMDSVAISYFLSNGRRDLRLHYVNHGTEYAKSAESKFYDYVKWLSDKSKIKITGLVHNEPPSEKLNKEAEFRDFRYGYFDSFFKNKKGINELVVCHHLDDAIESYLMNAFTSATYDRKLPETTQRENYNIIRPFLLTPKENIIKYSSKEFNNLTEWIVEDPSNQDTSIRRNWIRLVIAPQIKEQYAGLPKVVKKLYNEKEGS